MNENATVKSIIRSALVLLNSTSWLKVIGTIGLAVGAAESLMPCTSSVERAAGQLPGAGVVEQVAGTASSSKVRSTKLPGTVGSTKPVVACAGSISTVQRCSLRSVKTTRTTVAPV